jgi:hypothetical protein
VSPQPQGLPARVVARTVEGDSGGVSHTLVMLGGALSSSLEVCLAGIVGTITVRLADDSLVIDEGVQAMLERDANVGLGRRQRVGQTISSSPHDQPVADAAERIVRMKDGRVVDDGMSPAAVT